MLGGDQRFEQPIEASLDPLAEHEAVVAGELTRVAARLFLPLTGFVSQMAQNALKRGQNRPFW